MDSWILNCLDGNTNPQRRGLDLDLDLNYPLPPQMSAVDLSLALYTNNQQAPFHGWCSQSNSNVVQVDDEVAIISPGEFAQARQNYERNKSHGIPMGCADATALCNNCNRRIPDDCQPCVKPGTSNKKKTNAASTVQETPKSVPVPEESIFSCPICIGPLIEPTTTRCGHIFCKECLLRSLKSLRSKCPTCRQKVGKRGIFRVYLPTTN